MRLGSTSYVWPADILPNVERLAELVDDIELVLFEVDDYGSNLPSPEVIERLAELAAAHDLTYTVHLPLDLRLAAADEVAETSVVKARRVIERTAPLAPWGYVAHLEGEHLPTDDSPAYLAAWRERARRSVARVGEALSEPARLCLENLESWDPVAFEPLIGELGVSRCLDIGHFWLMGRDPLPYLEAWLPETRIVHLHGLADRDHRSLAHQPPDLLDPVVERLLAFAGVVTLEVFGLDDLNSSRAAWAAAVERVTGGATGPTARQP